MIFKQRKIGTFIGMVKIIIGNISPYAGWLSLALVGVMSFYTTIYPLCSSWGIEIQFWQFCVVLVLIVLATAIIEYVFMMPSYYEANNRQAWDSGGPLQDNIKSLRDDITKIKKKLDIQDE
jgi:uncharacterized membrane protein